MSSPKVTFVGAPPLSVKVLFVTIILGARAQYFSVSLISSNISPLIQTGVPTNGASTASLVGCSNGCKSPVFKTTSSVNTSVGNVSPSKKIISFGAFRGMSRPVSSLDLTHFLYNPFECVTNVSPKFKALSLAPPIMIESAHKAKNLFTSLKNV